MGNELAIPYLEKEAIIAVINRESQYNALRRVSPLFARMGHGAEKIEVRVRSRSAHQLRHTTMDGEGVPIRSGTMLVREYSPSWLKAFAELNSREIAMFRSAAEAKQVAEGGVNAINFQQRANDLIRELGQALEMDLGAERERLCVDAIQSGNVSAALSDGETQSVAYGLAALTAPSTKWDSASATIITNLYAAIDEFKANNPRGIAPNVAFYHPSLYKNAFVGNTEWKEFKKSSPDLAAGYLRLSGTRSEADTEGYFTDPLFNLRWIPVDGTYKDLSAASQTYWNYKNITLARIDLAGFEWGMTFGHEYNPRPEVNIEIQGPSRPDVKTWQIHAFDNGLPVIKEPELVQTWRVIT